MIEAEEAAFLGTLRTGRAIFDTAVAQVKSRGATQLGGEQAFQLHDTYGFPIDLTLEMAAEQGLTVDEDTFRRLMSEQRDRARRDAQEKKTGNADVSVFADLLERVRPCHVHRIRPGRRRSHGHRPAGERGQRCRPRRPGPSSGSCSTAPRSTPRAVASSPTPA